MFRCKRVKWLACAALTALTLSVSVTATAQEKSGFPGKFSANVALASEYYFRGLSQTDDAPALQGGFDYEYDVSNSAALYLGLWGSNVDFNEPGFVDGATVEFDLYGGLKGKVGRTGFSWDVGFIYYAYPGAASGLNYDYWEVQGAVGYDLGFATVTGSINYSADNFSNSGEAAYNKLTVEVPVPGIEGLSVTGHIAEQYIENDAAFGTADYIEWNLGAMYNVAGLFDLSIHYSDTDISPDVEGKDEAIILTVSRKF